MVIYGVNPVAEALRAGRVTELAVSVKRQRGLTELVCLAEQRSLRIRRVDRAVLERLAGSGNHQGVVATVTSYEKSTVAQLVATSDAPLIVVLDGIEDPQNLGAIVRSAEAAGAAGVVTQTRRAAPIAGTAVKASAGALVYLPIAPVINIARALDELKAAGIWTVGLDSGVNRSIYDLDLRIPVAFVVGSESRGLRRLVRDRCDWKVSLPMKGRVSSLNASVATGIALFEAVRQRSL